MCERGIHEDKNKNRKEKIKTSIVKNKWTRICCDRGYYCYRGCSDVMNDALLFSFFKL